MSQAIKNSPGNKNSAFQKHESFPDSKNKAKESNIPINKNRTQEIKISTNKIIQVIPLLEPTEQEEEKNTEEKSKNKENTDINLNILTKEKNEKDNNYLNEGCPINGYISYKINKMDIENKFQK